MEELTDKSPMPFGEHKDKPMEEVPADYFHFLWTKGGYKSLLKASGSISNRHKVARYIQSRLNHLRSEHPDGIWD